MIVQKSLRYAGWKSALLTSLLLTGCASPYAGFSEDAIENRREVAAKFLDTFAPAGCSFNNYKEEYQCDGAPPEKLNARVQAFINECMAWLREHPWGGNSDYIGDYAMSDFFYCRDKEGKRIADGANVFYCESELPPILVELMRDDGYSVSMSEHGGRYKYVAFKP